jgi:hypothetical protein
MVSTHRTTAARRHRHTTRRVIITLGSVTVTGAALAWSGASLAAAVATPLEPGAGYGDDAPEILPAGRPVIIVDTTTSRAAPQEWDRWCPDSDTGTRRPAIVS